MITERGLGARFNSLAVRTSASDSGPVPGQGKRRRRQEAGRQQLAARTAPDVGRWEVVFERFARWEADGTWAKLLEHVQVRDDAVGQVEWTVSVDSTINRAHQHAAGARKKGPQAGTNWKIRATCRRARPSAGPEVG
jgi:transposase